MSADDLFTFAEQEARARATDPQTSHAAAGSVHVRESQKTVLELLKQVGPVTDDELLEAAAARRILITPSGLHTRRCELVQMGLAVDTGDRKKKQTGRMAIVWDAVA
jgi:hypothetical protein